MRYYLIAGEASGDLHGSNLIKELKCLDPDATIRCWGGDLMKGQGGELVKHYRDLAFMGFTEVISHLPVIFRNLRFCKEDILKFNPDVLILVDYPGFNLRIAKFASKQGIRVFYYISPQLWAWNSSRVKKIKSFVERMFVILPFEKEFYARYGYSVDYVGHPLMDVITDFETGELHRENFLLRNNLSDTPVIAILPGSRKMEIGKMVREMLSVISSFPDYQFVIAAAPSIDPDFYTRYTGNDRVRIVSGQTYELLRNSAAALVTSGTATLEAALLGVPQVVCYKGNYLSYEIARKIVKVKFISLVNLIADKQLVVELIQQDLTRQNIEKELIRVLGDETVRQQIFTGYERLREQLGGRGAASRTAALMVQYLRENRVYKPTK